MNGQNKKKGRTWLGWILFGLLSAGGIYVGMPSEATAPIADAVSGAVSDVVTWDD